MKKDKGWVECWKKINFSGIIFFVAKLNFTYIVFSLVIGIEYPC